jgi:hypothetical protein
MGKTGNYKELDDIRFFIETGRTRNQKEKWERIQYLTEKIRGGGKDD